MLRWRRRRFLGFGISTRASLTSSSSTRSALTSNLRLKINRTRFISLRLNTTYRKQKWFMKWSRNSIEIFDRSNVKRETYGSFNFTKDGFIDLTYTDRKENPSKFIAVLKPFFCFQFCCHSTSRLWRSTLTIGSSLLATSAISSVTHQEVSEKLSARAAWNLLNSLQSTATFLRDFNILNVK